jgi:hypothetical protein
MAGVSTPSKLSYGAVAAGIGGLVLLLSLFLDWAEGANAFDLAFDIMPLVLLVVAVLSVGFAAIEATKANVNLPFDRARALTTLGTIAVSITWIFFLETQEIGIALAALSAAAILAGGILAEKRPHLSVAIGGGQGGQGGYGPPPGGPGGYAQPPAGQPAYGQQPQAPPPGGFGAPPTAAQPAPPPVQASSPAPPPGGTPDWYPDPKGEKRLRYYDGNTWTDHVAD